MTFTNLLPFSREDELRCLEELLTQYLCETSTDKNSYGGIFLVIEENSRDSEATLQQLKEFAMSHLTATMFDIGTHPSVTINVLKSLTSVDEGSSWIILTIS